MTRERPAASATGVSHRHLDTHRIKVGNVTSLTTKDQQAIPPQRVPVQVDLRDHADHDALHLRRLMSRLAKKRKHVALVFLIVLVPAVIATLLATPLYRSTALLQINSDPVQVMPYRDVAETVGAANFENYMGTQEQLLTGSALRDRVARRLQTDLKGTPAAVEAASLGDRFSIRKIEKSQLFELSYLAEAPGAAATVVNLFAEEFVKQHFEMRQAMRVKAEQQLKDELAGLEKRLQTSETELMTYAQANNIMSLEQGQVDPLQQRLTILTQQVGQTEGNVDTAKSALDSLMSASVANFPQRLMSQELIQLQGRLLVLARRPPRSRGTRNRLAWTWSMPKRAGAWRTSR
jgi:uncharacterized protein involved in exopolysaccharide biosynthesis